MTEVIVEFLNVSEEFISIDGYVNLQSKSTGFKVLADRESIPVKFTERFVDNDKQSFVVELPTTVKSISFIIDGQTLPLETKRFTHVSRIRNGYFATRGIVIVNKHKYLIIRKCTPYQLFIRELLISINILINIELKDILRQFKKARFKPKMLVKSVLLPVVRVLKNAYYVLFRLTIKLISIFYVSDIWIVSDRITAAGDNGEALFKYIMTHKPDRTKVYFAISKKSTDFIKVKRSGPVVDRDGFRYKILFVLSRFIISSHADDFVINPFGRREMYLRDMFKFDYVFLQHGITKDDISGWLNKYNKNISLFVTAAKREYDSIINGNYYYSKKQVKLTGFPRYDLLKNNPKKKIVLAPTWRHYLSGEADRRTGERFYEETFKNSDYYKFYNSFLNDTDIIKAIEDNDIKIEFYLHPAHSQQVRDFVTSSDNVRIMTPPFDYGRAFSEGSLLITDYSSVAFDFAYLRKPVIYTQFDKEDFFSGHLYNAGYFDYKQDGFGPVIENYREFKKQIFTYINDEFKVQSKYLDRINNFYKYNDANSSQRVLENILEIKINEI